jgi:hypothetical protein
MSQPTYEQLKQMLADKEAELAAAKSSPLVRELSFKVSEKGACSVYGLNARFPITLYFEQWMRLIAALDRLKTFLEANKSKFTMKADKAAAASA